MDGDRAVGLAEGDQGLGADHAGGGGVDGPGNPAVGFGGWGNEGDGESGIGGVVSPVEGRVEVGEVDAGVEESVVGEGLGSAGGALGREWEERKGEKKT